MNGLLSGAARSIKIAHFPAFDLRLAADRLLSLLSSEIGSRVAGEISAV
jgi:hypothetical protein